MVKWALLQFTKIMNTTAYTFNNVLVNQATIKEDLRGFSSKSKPSLK